MFSLAKYHPPAGLGRPGAEEGRHLKHRDQKVDICLVDFQIIIVMMMLQIFLARCLQTQLLVECTDFFFIINFKKFSTKLLYV